MNRMWTDNVIPRHAASYAIALLLLCGCGSPAVDTPSTNAMVPAARATAIYGAAQTTAAASVYTTTQVGAAEAIYTPAPSIEPETTAAVSPRPSTNPDALRALAQLEAALRDLPPVAASRLPGDGVLTASNKLVLSGGTRTSGVEQELADLRAELAQLRTDMDMYLGQYLTELRRENEDLRRDLQLARAGQGGRSFGPDLTDLPAPGEPGQGGAFVPGAEGAPTPETTTSATDTPKPKDGKPAPSEAVALAVHGGLNYAVITEWGRSPQDVAQLGSKASSLKGMVCVVPNGSSDEQIVGLGRYFRSEYKDYDNINIEVFDDRPAAQAYVETNNAAPEHRVLSVSKHRQSGRDTILVLRNGALTEVGAGN